MTDSALQKPTPCQRPDSYLGEQGSSVLEIALIAPVLLLMLVGAVDLGTGCYNAIQLTSAAQAGALYGVQYPTDTTGIAAATRLGAPDLSGLAVQVVTGCECSDGTSITPQCTSTPSCTVNVVNYVDVRTSYTYSSLLPYPGVPSSFALTGRSRLRTAFP